MPVKSLIFWPDCWIYLLPSERECMKKVIKVLKTRKSICLTHISKEINIPDSRVRRVIDFLLVLRVVKVQQRKDARIYLLMKGWREKLDKALQPYKKPIYHGDGII